MKPSLIIINRGVLDNVNRLSKLHQECDTQHNHLLTVHYAAYYWLPTKDFYKLAQSIGLKMILVIQKKHSPHDCSVVVTSYHPIMRCEAKLLPR